MLTRLVPRLVPLIAHVRSYRVDHLRQDGVAGTVVLFITIPQAIAYAFLAGLPAEAGLYAALAGLLGYAVFGSSKVLAVGPTAIIAMMTLEASRALAADGTVDPAEVAVKLALLTGGVLLLLRAVNFGAVISFLSHAVVTGFMTAAASLIVINQLPGLLGLTPSPDTSVTSVINHVLTGHSDIDMAALAFGGSAIVALLLARTWLPALFARVAWNGPLADAMVKSAPMFIVVVATLVVAVVGQFDDRASVPVVGLIPGELPSFALIAPTLQEARELLPSALLIAMVVFMESTSIGTAMASRRRDKIEPNQELIGLGVANCAAAMIGGFPVAGSFARTIVSHAAGAVTPIASLVTALGLTATLLWFADLFYYLPQAALAAIIVMSASQLIDLSQIKKIFTFNTTDGVTFACTFLAVLATGVESGILIGVVISFVLLIRSSSQPHIAVVGRVGDSEHFRNIERHQVRTSPRVLAMRVDESLYFVNTRYIENFLFGRVADQPDLEHILLICTATNFIDTSGLEMLEELSDNLESVGVTLHLAEVKGPVMDKLQDTDFFRRMRGKVFFTTDIAMLELADV